MRLARLATGWVAVLILGVWYLASQAAYHQGRWAEHTQRIEQSPLPILSLVVLAALVALAFMPEEKSE
jgi:hypothetical protein